MDRGDFWVRKFSNRGFYGHAFFSYFYWRITIYDNQYSSRYFGDFLVRIFRTLGIFWFENGSKIKISSQINFHIFVKTNVYWSRRSTYNIFGDFGDFLVRKFRIFGTKIPKIPKKLLVTTEN